MTTDKLPSTAGMPRPTVRSTARKVERLLGYAPAVTRTLVVMDDENYVARLWPRDATLWKSDEPSQAQIKNSLGWLNIAVMIRKRCDDLIAFSDEIRSSGKFEDIVLLGMGGSSLCPEVFRQVFGPRPGYPRFHVLDSTVPAAVAAIDNKIDPAKTLFIVASKSGSTIEPQMFYRYFFGRVKAVKGDRAGENFIAITDPGTLMERQAKEASFRRIFTGASDIGGRYSALTMFGMVPAALMGIDIKVMLDRALHSVHFCSANTPTLGMPGARRAAVMATFAEAGRNKMTLIIEPAFESMGLWIEQLVAESTGKEGKGIIPIMFEPLGKPEAYGDDRFFVYIHSRETNDEKIESLLDALEEAGHPSLRIILNDPLNIGEEFFLWEFATALVGAWLKINPFDQPNVQESKDNTIRLIESFKSTGALPVQEEILSCPPLRFFGPRAAQGPAPGGRDLPACRFDGSSAAAVLKSHLSRIVPGDYFALTQYFKESPSRNETLQNIRRLIRDKFHVATTSGYGPRFLHSTGQLHKGGPNTGVFLQLTADDAHDLAIPDEVFTFGILKSAQAIGDFEALLAHDCRGLRVHLGPDIDAGLSALERAIEEAL